MKRILVLLAVLVLPFFCLQCSKDPLSPEDFNIDRDGDGILNSDDLAPDGDVGIQIVLYRFGVFVADGAWDSASEIFFIVTVDDVRYRIPKVSHFIASVGEERVINRTIRVDVPDDSPYHTIKIEMWDDDGVLADDLYDIDADDTASLNLIYDLKDEIWSGDSSGGYTEGEDAYLQYEIQKIVTVLV